MKIGRNDPCHCGSGKKYKKCCMAADEAAAPTFMPPVAPLAEPYFDDDAYDEPRRPRTAEERAIDAAFDRFAEAEGDMEQRIKIYREAMREPWMAADLAAELHSELFFDAVELGQRGRYDALVAELRESHPDYYEHDRPTYLLRRLLNAFAEGREDAVEPLVRELAPVVVTRPKVLAELVYLLSYHGRLSLVLLVLRTVWPELRASNALPAEAVDDFAEQYLQMEVRDWLDQHPDPASADASDPALLERLKPLDGRGRDILSDVVQAYRPGGPPRQWRLEEFDLSPPRGVGDALAGDPEDYRHLRELGRRFVPYAHEHGQVPWTRAYRAAEKFVRYLVARRKGRLERNIVEELVKPKAKPVPPRLENVLCPDERTLKEYLVRQLSPLMKVSAAYDAGALVECAPLWLSYLEHHALITPEKRAALTPKLVDLAEYVLGSLPLDIDPAVSANLRALQASTT